MQAWRAAQHIAAAIEPILAIVFCRFASRTFEREAATSLAKTPFNSRLAHTTRFRSYRSLRAIFGSTRDARAAGK
jgi:hypothetical protein